MNRLFKDIDRKETPDDTLKYTASELTFVKTDLKKERERSSELAKLLGEAQVRLSEC